MSAIGISKESIKTIMQNEQTTPTATKAAAQPAVTRTAPSKRPSARALKLRSFLE
jgi:nitrate/nitrite transport system permease protein